MKRRFNWDRVGSDVVATLLTITAPIWFLPALVFALFYFLYQHWTDEVAPK